MYALHLLLLRAASCRFTPSGSHLRRRWTACRAIAKPGPHAQLRRCASVLAEWLAAGVTVSRAALRSGASATRRQYWRCTPAACVLVAFWKLPAGARLARGLRLHAVLSYLRCFRHPRDARWRATSTPGELKMMAAVPPACRHNGALRRHAADVIPRCKCCCCVYRVDSQLVRAHLEADMDPTGPGMRNAQITAVGRLPLQTGVSASYASADMALRRTTF
jgi:hypothetical protein